LGAAAVAAFVESLRADERTFTPFDEHSAIRRIARGDLELADAPPEVREVEQACRAARVATGGRFDAWHKGWFDPTGYVKGWAVERAFGRHLEPLLASRGGPETSGATILAVGVNCGGDLRVATRAGADWVWRTGIVDPFDRMNVLATLQLTDGAVATSGPAERGAHITDPSTGAPAVGVASATVVADRLDHADLWATTAVVAGFDDLSWLVAADTVSGLLVADDGRTRRWAGVAEIVEQ
jgi:thiamine biosynthesis lipoprotein